MIAVGDVMGDRDFDNSANFECVIDTMLLLKGTSRVNCLQHTFCACACDRSVVACPDRGDCQE